MDRKNSLKRLKGKVPGLGFGLFSLLISCNQQEKPNIIFILTDDQGPWTLSSEGYPNTHTPEIDKIAEKGAILKNAYSVSAVSSPSRAALITGRYPSEVKIIDVIQEGSFVGLDTAFISWPKVLQKNGYRTALIGKWHLGVRNTYNWPEFHGYEKFSGFPYGGVKSKSPEVYVEGKTKTYYDEFTSDVLTDLAINYISEFKDEPFLVSLHYWAPHANTTFPDGYTLPYKDRSWLPLKDEDLDPWKKMNLTFPEPNFPFLDTARLERMMREYYASLHSVDRNIGRLMRFLEEQDLSDNTIVIFTSDNGYMLGHHGMWHKGSGRWITLDKTDPSGIHKGEERPNLYQHSIHIPFVVQWPNEITPGTVIMEKISFLDIFPTILAMADIEVPANVKIHGRNTLPLIQGKQIKWDESHYAEYKNLRSYSNPEWKMVIHFDERSKDELYNLKEDPDEFNNLICSENMAIQNIRVVLEKTIIDKMRELNDPILKEISLDSLLSK